MSDVAHLAVMTPVEYGEYLASLEPPISDEQAEAAARVLYTVTIER